MSNPVSTVQLYWQFLPSWLQLVLVGCVLGSTFIQPYFAPLLFLSLPLFWYQLVTASSLTQALWRGWLVWYVKSLFALFWFFSTYPLDSVEVALPAGLQLLAIAVYLATGALWLSAGGLLLGGGVWLIHQWFNHICIRSIFIAGWLVVCEVTGAWVFSVATTAPDIPLTSAFAFGFVGVPSVVIPGLIGWAMFGGSYALAGLVGLYTALVTYQSSWRRRWYGVSGGALCLVGGGLLLSYTQLYNHPSPTKIAVIETDFSAVLTSNQAGRLQQTQSLKKAFVSALEHNPEYVLFPEGAGFINGLYPGVDPATAYNFYRFDFNDPVVVVQDSVRLETARGAVLRGITFDGHNKVVSQFDKQYLVPQGEYVPQLYAFVLHNLGYTEVLASMRRAQSYRPGQLSTPTVQNKNIPPILFCFSSSDPRGVRKLDMKNSAPFVAHPISHAWFHEPDTLWYQLDQFLRIQAVWNQVPIVSAANLAPSHVYWPDGAVTQGAVVASGELWRVRLVTLP